ncbi:MAG: dihydrodipicolinate synthetase family protein, partial [Geminicoccaceae bacterium]|nr:dihydrodipicolinate synthetase family protein [Geminicoccaceae bacterium]
THSSWLLSSLVMGCGGLLSGAGSVIADLQVALFKAVQAKDLARAQAINRRIYPLAHAFYAPPFLDMHNRMKETLVLLGRMPRAVVRPACARRSPRPGSAPRARSTSPPDAAVVQSEIRRARAIGSDRGARPDPTAPGSGG